MHLLCGRTLFHVYLSSLNNSAEVSYSVRLKKNLNWYKHLILTKTVIRSLMFLWNLQT